MIQAILAVEPRLVDSDYDLAFRSVGNSKRGLVVVFTDLVDEAAARSLLAAVPVLARRHAVVVASVTDPDLHDAMVREPQTTARRLRHRDRAGRARRAHAGRGPTAPHRRGRPRGVTRAIG